MVRIRLWLCLFAAAVATGLEGGVARGQACPGEWVDTFGGGDFDDWVLSLAVYKGELVAGGGFRAAGDAKTRGPVRWTGDTWESLGQGLPGYTSALLVDGDRLIAGGWYILPGDPDPSVAVWDGAAWTYLPDTSLFDDVAVLVMLDGSIVAAGAGRYTVQPPSVVGRWTGSDWEPLGFGFNETIYCAAVFDGQLYIGGRFDGSSAEPVSRVARWNGARWEQAFPNPDFVPYAMAVFDDRLVLGTSGLSDRIYAYDGKSWEVMAEPDAPVRAMSATDRALLCGGYFTAINGEPMRAVALWDGSQWAGYGDGLETEISAVTFLSDSPVAGGLFTRDGLETRALNRVARWTGATWETFEPIGNAPNGPVRSLIAFEGLLFAAPEFGAVGEQIADLCAAWDGRAWNPKSFGWFDNPLGFVVFRGDLFAHGAFLNLAVNNHVAVTRWTGDAWVPDSSVIGWCDAAVEFRDRLVIAGNPLYMLPAEPEGGGIQAAVAAWDGMTWGVIPTGSPPPYIRKLHVYNNDLIALGNFDEIGGIAARNIARWDGEKWFALGDGLPSSFNRAVVNYRGDLWVSLRRWNGSSWSQVPPPPGISGSGIIEASVVYDGLMFVGGRFDNYMPNGARGIAAWDGTSWHAAGIGVDVSSDFVGRVSALAVFDPGDGRGPQLFAGGSFNFAGGFSSRNLAQWAGCTCPGDFTGDRSVDTTDLNILLSQYGNEVATAYEAPDLTGDRLIDCDDLNILLSRFGEQCPPAF